MSAVSLISASHDVGVGSESEAEKKYYSYVQILAGHENAVGKKIVTMKNNINEF